MEQLTGKVAFITGGASGIGLGMARAFLEEGMKVSLADWNDEHIAKAKAQLAGNNAVHFVKTNVAERDSLRNAAQETLDAFGKIHVLCNNAGVNGGGTAASEDFDDWDRALSVNLGGVVNGTKIIAPIIRQQGEGGHIVNTSSMAGVVPLPEDDPEHIKEEGAPQFLKDLWDAMRGAIDPYDTGKAVVEAIKANRFYIFTNREFLEEVQQRHREIEDAFPSDEPTPGRVKFEQMRAEMVRNLMAPGNRPVPAKKDGEFALDLGSASPAGGQ